MNFNPSCVRNTKFERYPKLIYKSCTQNELHFTDIAHVNTELFWTSILQDKAFEELTCLIAPVSNAVVERIFSLVSPCQNEGRKQNAAESS
jgi:hypothetical protein